MVNRRQGLQTAVALAGLALSGGVSRAQSRPAVVSLSEQRSRFLVEVAVDGTSGYRFVLDTGATAHFISTRLVDQLRLPRIEERTVRGAGGPGRDTVVGIARFNVGGVEMGRSRAVAWAPERLEDHDGLVGYPFLFPRAVIALREGRISLGAADAAAALTPVRAEVTRSQALLLGGVAGADGRFVFDTGSQACTISPAYHARIRDTEAYRGAVKLVYRDAEGEARTTAFRPARMSFGDFAVADPIVRVGEADGREGVFHGVDGLLGVSLLRPYSWAVDQAAGTLSVGGEAPQRLGWYGSGMRVAQAGGRSYVSAVADHGPAFEAGVRPGQGVVSLSAAPSDVPGLQVVELLDRGVRRLVELETRALL
ncbi:MAG TPA: aspartyl protease family protein [Caulobacteraceae bacterium]|jgi:predicted aspartyl protease|nr:aspartyl protease family protein [Caulobacteraceae bacterium]